MNGSHINDKEQLSVQIVNCSKSYKTRRDVNTVFSELNLNIPKSCIFALLGASGCGKTTLLRCILGRLDLTKGHILVNGYPPGSVKSGIPGFGIGYMPQDVALCELMTIGETLLYYGRLVGMPDKEIQTRIDFYVKYLHMPPKDTKTGNLSGGQKRRVSFAVATMHKPKLIILDEPTVGIDPIVKHSMITFLQNLVREFSCTIILTTHYIEEARDANRVGMLRNGRLIVNDTPEEIIKRFNASSLEEVFLKICQNQSDAEGYTMELVTTEVQHEQSPAVKNDVKNQNPVDRKQNNIYDFLPDSFISEIRLPNPKRVYATTVKNFLRLRRFPGAILFLFIFPIFQFGNGCFALGGYIHDIKIGIFNEDVGYMGNQFLTTLSSFVMKQETCLTYELCNEALMNGKTYGMIHIPANFSQTLAKRINESPFTSIDSIIGSTIKVALDNSDFIICKTLNIDIMRSFQEFFRNVTYQLGHSREAGNHFLNIHEFDSWWLDKPFRVYMVPSFLIVCCFAAQVTVAVLFLFLERIQGYLERAFIAGTTTVEVILSFVVMQFIVITGQVAGVLLLTFLVFDTPLIGSIFLVTWLGFLSGINGMSVGLAVSAIFNDILTLATMSIVFSFIILAVSASFWPIEAMPYVLQYISKALPFYFPAKALTDIMYRGWTLYDATVFIGFAESFVWSMILLVLTSVCFKIKS